MDNPSAHDLTRSQVAEVLRRACSRLAPVWPLENFVAVNPYLAMVDEDLASVANRLRRVAGARMTLPTSFYLEALDSGRIGVADIEAAMEQLGLTGEVSELLEQARSAVPTSAAPSVPTVADVLTETTGSNWARFTTDRISAWAAAYFDEGEAAWPAPRVDGSLFASWRAETLVDRTPDVMGLAGFRSAVRALPEDAYDAAVEALRRLDIPPAGLDVYLHRLLMRVGGWAAHAARLVWENNLAGEGGDDTLVQFLCVQIVWEAALLRSLSDRGFQSEWEHARRMLAEEGKSTTPGLALACDLALHLAYERASQNNLVTTLNHRPASSVPETTPSRPSAQAIFCIDVRSEVLRRHLESADSGIETLGFAGFFGFPIEFIPLAHQSGGAHCPVLLRPTHRIRETLSNPSIEERVVERRHLRREVERAWKGFKMGAVSCFSFVGITGLAYLPKLFTDGFGLTRPVQRPDTVGLRPHEAGGRDVTLAPCGHGPDRTGVPLDTRIEMASRALAAMSLVDGFARLVLVTGHGSSSINNPHATGLDCGACGGRSGEANARVAAAILNDPAVRLGLAHRGIAIPSDTHFLAALHDTTTDEVTILNRHSLPPTHAADLARLETSLAQAGVAARAERSRRFHLPPGESIDRAIRQRSRDWAQVRPEWGLAGCSTFLVAPRRRTRGLDLGGTCFLHSYEASRDEGFRVLELVMTAPMVVASWISLQYYASTVDHSLYGAGNKTLHNIVGRIGVLEGAAGDLRVGLPWQSVHDGERLQHDPTRLTVVIEAPLEAMNAVIDRHAVVRHLLDNRWISLLAMNDQGVVTHRYAGARHWEGIERSERIGVSWLARAHLGGVSASARPATRTPTSPLPPPSRRLVGGPMIA